MVGYSDRLSLLCLVEHCLLGQRKQLLRFYSIEVHKPYLLRLSCPSRSGSDTKKSAQTHSSVPTVRRSDGRNSLTQKAICKVGRPNASLDRSPCFRSLKLRSGVGAAATRLPKTLFIWAATPTPPLHRRGGNREIQLQKTLSSREEREEKKS